MLAAWGAVWGLLFGAIMNIWFWPYVYQPQSADMHWQSGLGLVESLKRYGVFYATTSLWWDLGRAGGNVALLLLFGAPVLRLLRRFGRRFHFERM
jgi:energy-coupling factor transport system substrate-specific component